MKTFDLTVTGLPAHIANNLIIELSMNGTPCTGVSLQVSEDPQPDPDPLFISPVPEGFDTVLGHLAKYHPEALEFDLWDPEATQRDGFWCCHRAKERDLVVCRVPAPSVLKGQNIKTVNAYPVALLQERFGGAV